LSSLPELDHDRRDGGRLAGLVRLLQGGLYFRLVGRVDISRMPRPVSLTLCACHHGRCQCCCCCCSLVVSTFGLSGLHLPPVHLLPVEVDGPVRSVHMVVPLPCKLRHVGGEVDRADLKGAAHLGGVCPLLPATAPLRPFEAVTGEDGLQ
jgi:hypothetical protein